MKKLLFLAPALLSAQSWFPFNAGKLQCGIVRRGTDTAQAYCYDTGVVIYNTYFRIYHDALTDDPNLSSQIPYTLTFKALVDGFQIVFTYKPDIIYYTLEVDGSNKIVDGELTDVLK